MNIYEKMQDVKDTFDEMVGYYENDNKSIAKAFPMEMSRIVEIDGIDYRMDVQITLTKI